MTMLKRLAILLLCIILTLSAFPFAHAENSAGDEDVTYILNYHVDGDGYSGPELMYFSPYRISCTLDGRKITMKNCIFALYNTVTGEVIPAYCTDLTVLANSNYTYRRLNLEDSTFSADASDEIRAIVRNGFYPMPETGESEEAHAARIAADLQRLGDAAGVEGLTVGEAITGTQSAIWQAAHGDSLVFTDFMLNMYMDDVSDSVIYYDICNEERYNGHADYDEIVNGNADMTNASNRRIGNRIKKVYEYLMSLDPIAPTGPVVSHSSFKTIYDPIMTDNGDGTFDLTITATVDVRINAGDHLTLNAYMADKYDSAELVNGEQTITLNLEELPDALKGENMRLYIEGQQGGFDVYLYDSTGDRDASQTMIGMLDSTLPVCICYSIPTPKPDNDTESGTETEPEPEFPPMDETEEENQRILNIYKTTFGTTDENGESYDRYPLAGIEFDIYFVAQLNDYLSGKVRLPKDAADYELPEEPDFTLVTGANGRVSINLTEEGMPDGVYLITEKPHPAIKAPIDPFFIVVPFTNPETQDYEYEINLHPKNEVKGTVKIEKDVISLGNDSASLDAHFNHTWIIGTSIPEDIAIGKSFEISDTLDPRLDYIGNMKVRVETVDGQTVAATLLSGSDYTVDVNNVDSLAEGKPSDSFTLSLTQMGMARIADAVGDNNYSDYMLRVYFDARINANAQLGVEIPNQATLKYTDSVNFDYSAESDQPFVYTGGAKVLKVDAEDNSVVLSGATFEVYRQATLEEVTAGESITYIPGVDAAVVKVSFYNEPTMTHEKVTSTMTGEDGVIYIYGLAYGEYYLYEKSAPDGYLQMTEPATLIINSTSHTDEKILVIENVSGIEMPETGGIGTTVFTVGGLVLLCAAALLLILKKRSYHS